jgi:light-regulated signal transduction histidine kinase (bacteriophytochrome)
VIHKVKNGLGGISGFASLLERDTLQKQNQKRYIKRIQDGVTKVNNLVVSLMTLAKEDDLTFQRTNFQSIIKEVGKSEAFHTTAVEHKAFNQLPSNDKQTAVLGDPHLLKKLVFYTIRFIHEVNGRVLHVTCTSISEKRVRVLIEFQTNGKARLPVDDSNWHHHHLPLESRLSLEIIRKIMILHGGRLVCQSHFPYYKMSMVLNKDIG